MTGHYLNQWWLAYQDIFASLCLGELQHQAISVLDPDSIVWNQIEKNAWLFFIWTLSCKSFCINNWSCYSGVKMILNMCGHYFSWWMAAISQNCTGRHRSHRQVCSGHSGYGLSQWETMLHCNQGSHDPGFPEKVLTFQNNISQAWKSPWMWKISKTPGIYQTINLMLSLMSTNLASWTWLTVQRSSPKAIYFNRKLFH